MNMFPLPTFYSTLTEKELAEIHDIVKDVDGFFYFWPIGNRGHFTSAHLQHIAVVLDVLNAPLQAEQDEYFARLEHFKEGGI